MELTRFISEEHKDWLIRNVFQYHPNWADKVGAGVLAVQVLSNEGRSTRGFRLHRTEGVVVSISITECFNASTPQQKYQQALRNEVEDQRVKAFTEQGGRHGIDEAHHVVPFKKIADLFEQALHENHYNMYQVLKTEYVGEPFGERLVDREIASFWKQWHKERAVWEVLPKEEHKAKTKEEHRKKE